MHIFDFDGVLIDSVNETVLTAYNAASGEVKTRHEQLDPNYLKIFLRNRHHVRPAGDFLPFARWCVLNSGDPERLITAQEYQEEILSTDDTPLTQRTAKFFATRKLFMDSDLTHWLSLHRPYQPLWKRMQAENPSSVVILTNKDSTAVLQLCSHFSIGVPKENIYSGESGATKRENLNRLTKRFGRPSYSFIDDSCENLIDLKNTAEKNQNLTWLLASWGYVGPDDLNNATKANIDILTQQDLIARLDGES